MEKFKKFIFLLVDILAYAPCVLIFANMAIVTCNVIARMAFGKPVPGLVDIFSLVSAAIAALFFGYTEKMHGFIQVDFVKEYLPKSIQKFLHIILGILAFVVMFSWMGFLALHSGIWGFVVMIGLGIAIVIAFPQIITFIPNMLY